VCTEGHARAIANLQPMPFLPVDPALDLVALERRWLEAWRAEDVFGETLRRRAGAPEWVFYEGPPTANGRPGIHHVWARLFKDIYPRFHTMRGRHVARKGGWDCHGLPVEVEVEKELGLRSKQDIHDYGIEAFNQRCRESVHRYVEDFQSLTERIAMWIDTKDAYWTLHNSYIESVWWLFHQMWEQDLIYEGHKVVPYCGRCGTALSSHELGQPGAYRDLTEPAVYVRFPLVDDDADLLVWTTTPWTLPSNVAVAVGPQIDYVRVRDRQGGRDLVLAAARVAEVLGEGTEVAGTVDAASLVGRHYERPFDWLPLDGSASRVVAADFVAVDEGSGIVHMAPGFGEVDREVGTAEGLPTLNPVGADATFDDPRVPEAYRNRFVKDADPALVDALAAAGRLVRVEDHTHSYPHCWRCGTPLIYWAKPTWFASTSARKADLLRENETIGWHPEHIKHGRFGKWLENNVDWALSRDRFWGTPLPVWRCAAGHDTCVPSVARLEELAGRSLTDLDLHRPYVDDVTIRCPECAGTAHRVEPVLDAWFDSGAMPTAQFHYPFENEELFDRRFPADFICEAIDQTRGWFYSLIAVNTLVFGRTPYRNVVCLALIVDRDGQKMSKSRGNVIDPWTVLDTRGADALRWNMFSASSPWTPKRVFAEAIDETTASFLLTLWNTYSFFVTYANLDGFERPAAGARPRPTHVLDRWIRSRLHHTVAAVTEALDDFDALAGAHALSSFVDDLSNWYVRRSRPRFWKASDPHAHATLHEALSSVALLLAPYCPFLTEEIHRNLVGGESVHLADWPEVDGSALDPALEARMATARAVVSLGRSARDDAQLGVRQPLSRALVLLADGDELDDETVREVAQELNVKRVEIVTTLEGLLDYAVVPNFRALGPRLGPLMPRVKELLATADGAAVRRALDDTGRFVLDVDGSTVELAPGDVEIRAERHEELALAQEAGRAVALDLALDDALRAEGAARTLVRAINDLRKAEGLAIADRIHLTIDASPALQAALAPHVESIQQEVLAVDVRVEPGSIHAEATVRGPAVHVVDVAGEQVAVTLERAESAPA
jgi:isoleucyl-tRNA synthetase